MVLEIFEDLEKLRGRQAGLILQEHCKKSAVIIPLIKTEDGIDVLFEVRSGKVGRQPGDVCFPGGKMIRGETPEQTAVRECCEELLIDPSQLAIVCEADLFHNANTLIYPFAAYLGSYDGSFSDSEVAEVFTVPLKFFLNTEPLVYDAEMRMVKKDDFPYHLIVGGENYKWPVRIDKELFYEYEGHVVWGITARIINSFVKLLGR